MDEYIPRIRAATLDQQQCEIAHVLANLTNHMTQVGPTVDNIVVPCLRYLSFKNTIL